MAADNKKKDENFIKSLAILRRRALDVKFDIDTTQYQPLENIGIGAYGVVCSAIHRKGNDRVAIKKIPNVFDVRDAAKRTYREIKILKHFKHDNIIHIREILKPKESGNDFKDVYVVFDLMESDLHKIIYSKQELTEEHVRYFLYQILRGLKYIHSAHVIHRDLKPSNLLVNEDCQLRIGDFGMARGFTSSPGESKHFMTQYVATRYYRAPEIMLSLIEYGAAVDMWSVGCIFAEMLGRKHLFPGKNSVEQIKLIVGCLGTPDNTLLDLCHSPLIRNFFQEMGHKEAVPWQKLYPKASKKAINLLSRMLVLNPKNRITVEQALVHPYLNKYHDPDDEPICVPTFNFDFENEDLSLHQLRRVIHKEIMEYHEPRTPTLSFNAELRPVPKCAQPTTVSAISKQGTEPTPAQLVKRDSSGNDVQQNLVCSTADQQSVTKPSDDDVFKRPLSAKNKEPSVTVQTDNLLKTEMSDIEMLSARSTDERQPMSATVMEEKDPVKELSKENQEPSKDNKTISQDTKNLIKAALMNASFKKRTDSVGDEERPKPVTAAMRQKEREDKRKKKKEKTMERKRKEKKKNAKTDELLTSEDKELLYRWSKMQQVNVPIAPRPRSDSTGQGHDGSNTDVSSVSCSSAITGQTSQQGSTSEPMRKGSTGQGHLENSSRGQGQDFHSNMRNVQQGTLDLLQQRILSNNLATKSETVTSQTVQQPVATATANTNVMVPNNTTGNDTITGTNSAINTNTSGTNEVNKDNHFSVDFSDVPLGDLDFLSMVTSPEIANILSQNIPSDVQQTSVSTLQSEFPAQNNFQYTNTNNGQSQSTFTDDSSQAFIQSLCTQAAPDDSRRTSGSFVPLELPQDSTSSLLSVSPNYQNRLSPNYQSSNSPGSQHSVSPNQRISPHFFDGAVNQPTTNQPHQQTTQNNYQSGSMQPLMFNFGNQSNMMPSDMTESQNRPSQNIPFQNMNMPSNSQDPSALFMSSREAQNQSVVRQQGNINYRTGNQSGVLQEVKDSHNSSSNSNSPPPLSVNTQQSQLSFQNIFQNPVPGPSNAGHQLDETQLDLVALLTKQLSKSNVEDFCPSLALTPRGTGAGYGLGVDLEALMNTTDNDGPAPEPSPLSSSILADWMEVTGNMNIDMEALEQELQSPMALSYNDLNMYPS